MVIPSVAGIFRNIVAAIFRDLSRYSPIFSDIPEQLHAQGCRRWILHASMRPGSPATPREARPFHGLIERDRALRAAFLPEVREFISQGVLISGWLCARRGAVAPGPYLGPQHGWKVRDIARYCAILRDIARYCAIRFDI